VHHEQICPVIVLSRGSSVSLRAVGRHPQHGAYSDRLKRTDIARIERPVKLRYGIRLNELNGYQRHALRLFALAYRVAERLEPLDQDAR
jgi:hypothetical protein